VPTARLLLLVTYRPEYTHAWGSKTYYQQLRLDALPTASAGELLEALLGPDPALADLRRLLIERTQGNPFFLEETVRALVETKLLTGTRGAYRLTGSTQTLQLPPTVQSILAARIDWLAAEDKRLLQAAAVIGKEVPFKLLQAIADEPDEEVLRRALLRLQAAEFVYEARLFPDLEYTFKHALTLEVAYGTMLLERRRALHASIAQNLQTQRLAEDVDRVARHAFLGEQWQDALILFSAAGRRAFGRSANSEAVTHFEYALEALAHLAQTRATQEQAVDIRLAMRHALFPLSDQRRVRQVLSEAREMAEALGDHARLGRVLIGLTHCLWAARDYRQALELGSRAESIAKETGDEWLCEAAPLFSGQVRHAIGDYPRAVELLAKRHEDPRRTLWVLMTPWLVWSLAELGDLRTARARAEEVVPAAEADGSPWMLSHACYALGLARLFEGGDRPGHRSAGAWSRNRRACAHRGCRSSPQGAPRASVCSLGARRPWRHCLARGD
jgi:hypothetical protein